MYFQRDENCSVFIFIVCNYKDKKESQKDAAMPDLDIGGAECSDMLKSYIFVRKSNDEMDRIMNG